MTNCHVPKHRLIDHWHNADKRELYKVNEKCEKNGKITI